MAISTSNIEIYPVDKRHARVALSVLVIALVVLGIAWAFQLIGGFTPCKLCLEQREGYYAAIPVLGIAALSIAMKGPSCVGRGLLAIAGLFLATSMVTGVFQAGAEWGFWLGPNDCGSSTLPGASSGSLLEAIDDTQIIFCDEAPIRILGLSFAGMNVLAAAPLAAACLVAAAWPGRRADT